MLDEQVVSIRGGGYHKLLIKWKGCPLNECTWITKQEFQYLDQDLYERYHGFNLSMTTFFNPRIIDRDKWQQPIKVYQM